MLYFDSDGVFMLTFEQFIVQVELFRHRIPFDTDLGCLRQEVEETSLNFPLVDDCLLKPADANALRQYPLLSLYNAVIVWCL